MFKRVTSIYVVLLALILSACNSDNDNIVEEEDPIPQAMSEIRVTHASPDAPAVNVYVNGTLSLEAVDYKVSSGIIDIPARTFSAEVRGILPDGSEVTVIGPVDLTASADED